MTSNTRHGIVKWTPLCALWKSWWKNQKRPSRWIQLIKFWLEVGQEEQARRFAARTDDPLRQWKLSPIDVASWTRWYDYSRARDLMLEATDTKHAPWYIVRSDDKNARGSTASRIS